MTQHVSTRLMNDFDGENLIMTVAPGDPESMTFEGSRLAFDKPCENNIRWRRTDGVASARVRFKLMYSSGLLEGVVPVVEPFVRAYPVITPGY